MIEVFCLNGKQFLAANYFCKKAPTQILERVLNMPQQSCWDKKLLQNATVQSTTVITCLFLSTASSFLIFISAFLDFETVLVLFIAWLIAHRQLVVTHEILTHGINILIKPWVNMTVLHVSEDTFGHTLGRHQLVLS